MTKPVLNSELVDTFWGLAEGQDEKRVCAAVQMISVLQRSQIEDDVVSADLDYTLQRLVRGLSSTRKWARLGYAMALTQVLTVFPVTTPDHVIKHVKDQLKVNDTEKSVDNSNALLGRVMVVLCIVESGALSKADKGDAAKLLKWLLKAKTQKMPIHHLCTLGIAQLIAKVADKCFKEELFPLLEEHLSVSWEKCTPDTLLLLLKSRQHHPKIIDKTFLTTHWNSAKLFCEVTWPHIAAVVIKSCSDHPIVHSVCHELIDQASQDPTVFTDFWTKVIDGVVLPKPGPKKYLCYQLVPQALKRAHTADQVSMIMSFTLVQSLVKNFSSPANLLYSASKVLIQELTTYVGECTEGDKQVAVLKALVAPPSNARFDTISTSNTVSTMESSLVSAGAQQWSKMLKAVVRGDISSSLIAEIDSDLSVTRSWAISQLANLIVIPSMAGHTEWQSDILQFLFTHGHFNVNRKCKVGGQVVGTCKTPLEVNDQTSLRLAFSKALHKVATFKSDKSAAKDSSLYVGLFYDLLKFIDGLLKMEDSATLLKEMNNEARSQWNVTIQKLEKIRSKDKDEKEPSISSALQLLMMQLALQIFSEADNSIELLQDVFVCYDKAFVQKKGSTKKSDSEEVSWVEVLTEVLLSLMSTNSAMVRTTINIVFAKMCSHMNQPALELILDVFRQKKGEEDGPLGFEDSEDDMDDEEESEGGENSEASDSSNDTDEDSEEESDEDKSDEDDTNDTKVSELRAKLKAELGEAALPSDNDDEEEEELEDFDDETMMKLDEKIAATFRQMTKNKKGAKETELQLVHFKMRCLDLLHTYVSSGPPVTIAVELLVPLLELMDFTLKSHIAGHKQMGNRLSSVYNTLCKTKTFSKDADSAETNKLLEIFEDLMQMSTKVSSVPMVKSVGSGCLLVMKQLIEDNETPSSNKTYKKLLKSLKSGLEDFCTMRNSKYNPSFFHHMCERQPKLLWSLTADLLKYASDPSVRVFCRTQVCSSLTSMINKATMQTIGPEEWASFTQKLMKKLPVVLEELVQQTEYRPRFVQDVLLVLHRVLCTDNNLKTECAAQMGDVLESLMPKVKSQNVTLIRKILKILSITVETPTKPSKRQRKRTLSLESAEALRSNSVHEASSEVNEVPKKKKKKKAKESDGNKVEQNGKNDDGGDVEMEDVNAQDITEETKTNDKKHKHKKAKKKTNNAE